MSFSEVNKAEKLWKILEMVGEIQKNKTDKLRITRVKFAGKNLVNFQVWRKNQETGDIFPIKDQKVSFNVDFTDKVIEILERV